MWGMARHQDLFGGRWIQIPDLRGPGSQSLQDVWNGQEPCLGGEEARLDVFWVGWRILQGS